MSERDAGRGTRNGAEDIGAEPPVVDRRSVVRALGLAPLAGLLTFTAPDVDRAARRVAALGTASAEPAAPFAPSFFTAEEYETVRLLADYVIPKDERSGSATDAKVPEFIDFILADDETSPSARTAIRGGLAWLDAESRARSGKRFVEATDGQRRAILDDIAWPAKARPEMSHGVAFFNRFRDLVASGFFSSAMGFEDLRYMGNTFVPVWNGCPPEALAKLGVGYPD